ncbi:hypothetical protein [Ekhidna sp.]|uniref:DUF4961 domain-containing protein n=1 Tax=Ekhidna sp. TaxID=2608089 RepID=UPI00351834A8
MKKFISFISCISVLATYAQITIEPEEWLPCEEITLTIDISQGDCQSIVDSDGPLYMWTWMPAGPAIDGGNGEWSNSNDALELTKTGDNLWSYTMVPTEFYGVEADVVYANGFSLLVKEKDGGGGGDCSATGGEFKTSDYTLAVAPPFTSAKLFALPKAVFTNDVFSFHYDNTLETKETMQNLEEIYVYAAAIAGGVEYPISDMSEVGNNDDLKMTSLGDGKFVLSFVPNVFFTDVPAEQSIEQLLFIVRKKDMLSDDDRVEEDAYFDMGCEAAGGGC